jgi:hypothetical protein
MDQRVACVLALSAFVLAVSGCGGDAFKSNEDRVNAAFPVDAQVSAAVSKVEAGFANDSDRSAWRREYETRQKLRALTCASAFEPSWLDSTDDIRRKLNKPECFSEFDGEQLKWLKWVRTGLLVNQPPLRPIPREARRIITATAAIQTVAFADSAGVALAMSSTSLEIIDMEKDESILVDRQARPYQFRPALSPNGRVFAAISQAGGSDGVRLRESESGETLIEISGVRDFQWLENSTAWIVWNDRRGAELMDLATGKSTPVKGMDSVPTQLLRIAQGDTFLARAANRVSTIALKHDAGRPQLTLVNQRALPMRSWSGAASTLTTDGKYFVHGSSKLAVTNVATLETEEIPLEPFSAVTLSPLKGHELLVNIRSSASVQSAQAVTLAVFDAEQRTFALIEDSHFEPSGTTNIRALYIPLLARIGVISGATIQLVDDFKTGLKFGPQPFVSYLQEQQAQRQQQLAQSHPDFARSTFLGTNGASVVQQPTGDLPLIAHDAQIEAVGVYKSSLAPSRPGRQAGRGPITVIVRKAPKPIVLVLSSYDSVDWRLSVDPRAQLKAVLISGYSDSTVQGAGSVRTLNIGRSYAYERGSTQLRNLERDVVSSVGKTIHTFQGKYEASSFTVGGN